MKILNILILVVVIAVIGAAFYYYIANFLLISNQTGDQQESALVVGGDKDEHGCLVAAGYSWCEDKGECLRYWEEACMDTVKNTLTRVAQETGINFSDQKESEMKWFFESEDGMENFSLKAYEIEAEEVSPEDFEKIEKYFTDNGFVEDFFNAAGGVTGTFSPYRQDGLSLVCTVAGTFSDLGSAPKGKPYVPTTDKKDTKVACGVFEKSELPEISVEKRIKEALAEKYNKKVSEVEVTISQESENHTRGTTVFQPGGAENSGMFLSAKIDGEWQIIFDGNGTVDCQGLQEYGFPENMLEGICY